MTFNSKGYLEAGLHPMNIDDMEKSFVTPFPHSSTRKNILDNYKKHTDELLQIISDYIQFVDGSFVSNKNDPGDVDLICFIDGDVLDALPPSEQNKIGALLAGKLTKASHMCDAYFCPMYPEHHPNYEFYRSKRKYWMGEFGFDRTDVPKGVVVVERKAAPMVAAAAAAAAGVGP